jgi:lysophospholipase L1-like esterase
MISWIRSSAILCAFLLAHQLTFSDPATQLNVVVLGSSTAAGANATPVCSSWVNQYASYLLLTAPGSTLTNFAVGGYTTFRVMPTGSVPPSPWNTDQFAPVTANNITAALALSPDLIIINLPTNDADLHIPVEQQMQNYTAIVSAAAARGIPVWVSTSQPRTNGDDVGRALLMAVRTAILETFQKRALDFWTGLADSTGRIIAKFDSDGAHLNNEGHTLLYHRAVAAITLTRPALPSVIMHPRPCSVVESDSASFFVVAMTTSALTYRWQRNGVDIAGATSSRYTIAKTVKSDSGATFRCIVSGGTVKDTSVAARLTVRKLTTSDREVISDDFRGSTIDLTRWSAVDPLGDAIFALSSDGGNDAYLAITVPTGTAHDLWTGPLNAPRLLQQVRNGDLSVEAKFISGMDAEYQTQGIVAVQDASTVIRFDFVFGNGKTRFFVASIAGGTPTIRKDTTIVGTPPLFLRVARRGNAWTASISGDGTSWTTASTFTLPFVLTAIGPFAGNAGTAPRAFTALIDYFFNTIVPIVPEDGVARELAAPAIVAQPLSLTIRTGDPASFAISATGTEPMAYQWLRDNIAIPGATKPVYTITSAARSDSGAGFRCIVTNPLGNASSTSARLTVIPPVTSPVRSDAFNSAAIDTSRWKIVNPLGDAVVSMTGTHLRIALPSGTAHDLWPGAFTAPRVLQNTGNTDLSVDVKFDGTTSAEYQTRGVIAMQDSGTFVRFDFIGGASTTRFYAASFAAGVPTVRKDTLIASQTPMYMRVQRTGSTWTAAFSYSGRFWRTAVSFSAPFTLSAIGPFAGNAGSKPPAFTTDVDYFMNTSDVTAIGSGSGGAGGDEDHGLIPGSYALMQNYPNPFNPSTTIAYVLPEESYVVLRVCNALGAHIATPVEEVQGAGHHHTAFDGSGLASGVYFYTLEARPVASPAGPDYGNGTRTFRTHKSMLLIR